MLLDRLGESLLRDEVEHHAPRRHRERISRERARLVDGPRRRHLLHHVLAAAEASHRQPPADYLAQAGHVGLDAIALLRPAARDPEAGHHLVEDEERFRRTRLFPEHLEESRPGDEHTHVSHHRLDDGAGRLLPLRRPEEGAGRVGIVEGEDGGELRQLRRHSGRIGESQRLDAAARANEEAVRRAVIAAFVLHDALAPGEPASDAQRAGSRFRAARDEAYPLHARDQPAHALAEVALPRRGSAEARPVRGGVADRFHDVGMRVPREERSPAEHVVDEPVAIDVDEVRAFTPCDEERLAAHRAESADRAVHTAGKKILRASELALRPLRPHGGRTTTTNPARRGPCTERSSCRPQDFGDPGRATAAQCCVARRELRAAK